MYYYTIIKQETQANAMETNKGKCFGTGKEGRAFLGESLEG
jgi:hypothetical protein